MHEALYLTSQDVRGLASPAEYVDAVREAYRERGSHPEDAPAEPRTKLVSPSAGGMLTGYFAVLPETGAMGAYVYSAGFAAGDAWFTFTLFDAESGKPLAVLDGAAMNPYKTGAAGAVGVDALARKDAPHLGLIGSGTQARGQVRAVNKVRDLERVEVYSPTKQNREDFADEMREELGVDLEAVGSSREAVRGADVVITATTASAPVFDGSHLQDGAHVTAMGQYDAGKREVDSDTVRRAKYVPDLRARTRTDAGAFIQAVEEGAIAEDHVHAELGEVVAGEAEGRTSDGEVTLFDSGGTAIETTAAAYMLYRKASSRDLGSRIELAPASEAME